MSDILARLDQTVRKQFDENRRVLTFGEYLHLISEDPHSQTRSSAQYLLDMLERNGKTSFVDPTLPEQKNSPEIYHFNLFDQPFDATTTNVIGHQQVQTEIYRSLRSFVRQGINNQLILLHGPNGSAKTTLCHSLMAGMENYSLEKEGAVYSFNWVFPLERTLKSSMGIQGGRQGGQYEASSHLDSYAKLPDENVAARIPCELKDHPLLLIPKEQRREVLEELAGKDVAEKIWPNLSNYLKQGGLCHRCRQIYDALLESTGGDYRKVLMHIQVHRFFYSRRYREGLVTIEPQMHVDARYSQLTLNKSVGSLPASLQNLNFFSLSGDLIDGNRGVIEFSDLLKRPIDTFKYLLIACETGAINVGSSIAYLDTVLVGTTNELQLDSFKEFPDFSSFKARIKLIRVPYLLRVSQEERIYKDVLSKIGGDKHQSPHVAWTLALWAVLTRLKKPNSINYPPNISSLISNLSPMDKARLYDRGDIPVNLSPEDRKLLKSNLHKLRDEYTNIPYYEGRVGASVREVRGLIFDALQDPSYPCLSPLSILRSIENFIKRVSEYDFLKQDVKDGYHDVHEFIKTVTAEYLNLVDREVRECIGLYDTNQWEEFIRKYVNHTSSQLKREKVQNRITGKMEDPDLSLMKEFEKIVGAPKEDADLESFRRNIISQVGAWSLDHPNTKVSYRQVFPNYWQKLEAYYYDQQKSELTKMHNALNVYDTKEAEQYSEGSRLARQTIDNMQANHGYCKHCAKEVITFLMKKRY